MEDAAWAFDRPGEFLVGYLCARHRDELVKRAEERGLSIRALRLRPVGGRALG